MAGYIQVSVIKKGSLYVGMAKFPSGKSYPVSYDRTQKGAFRKGMSYIRKIS